MISLFGLDCGRMVDLLNPKREEFKLKESSDGLLIENLTEKVDLFLITINQSIPGDYRRRYPKIYRRLDHSYAKVMFHNLHFSI
jgi:hypothetical protein